jgi:hypothetical protein
MMHNLTTSINEPIILNRPHKKGLLPSSEEKFPVLKQRGRDLYGKYSETPNPGPS